MSINNSILLANFCGILGEQNPVVVFQSTQIWIMWVKNMVRETIWNWRFICFPAFWGGHWISFDKNHLCRIAYFSITNNTTCHDVNTCQIQQLTSPEYIFLAARTCTSFAAPDRWQQWRLQKIAKLALIHLKMKKTFNISSHFQPIKSTTRTSTAITPRSQ